MYHLVVEISYRIRRHTFASLVSFTLLPLLPRQIPLASTKSVQRMLLWVRQRIGAPVPCVLGRLQDWHVFAHCHYGADSVCRHRASSGLLGEEAPV